MLRVGGLVRRLGTTLVRRSIPASVQAELDAHHAVVNRAAEAEAARKKRKRERQEKLLQVIAADRAMAEGTEPEKVTMQEDPPEVEVVENARTYDPTRYGDWAVAGRISDF